ncbi:hypothetical protein JCM3770_005237 [Rhodotorula araucariae]
MASMSPPADGKKTKVATCRYCDMTFRKLEHAQRHERTHTLDRPYACDTCGKTFARQDTLHRHTRLHSRKEEDGPTGKAPRKRRTSNASSTKPPIKAGGETSPGASSSGSSSSSAGPQLPIPVVDHAPVASTSSSSAASNSTLFSGIGLSVSLPVAVPSFPAYSHPELAIFPSIDPSFIPLSRRFSDAGYPATLASASLGTSAPSASSSALAGAVASAFTTRPERPSLRPRAMTLAGLPESLGCFSLINSPASTHASLDDDDSSMSSDDDEDDSDVKVQSSSTSSDGETGGGAPGEDCSTSWTASFPPPESHYPSPAFSAYSPSHLQADPLSELQSILENDPVPSSAFQAPSPPPTAQPEFDYESFAASIEGPAAGCESSTSSSSSIPTTLEELFRHGAKAAAANGANRYPTPPSGSAHHLLLPVSSESSAALTAVEASASFDLAAHLDQIISAESEQQARADRAATAAMFASGFGVTRISASSMPLASPGLAHTGVGASSNLSALGLNFGPAPVQVQAQVHNGQHRSPCLSLPLPTPPLPTASSAPTTAKPSFSSSYALSATFATTYPSLSLPVAGFDLPTSTALKYDSAALPALAMSLPSATLSAKPASPDAVGAGDGGASRSAGTTTESMHDLLARAWERRQRSAVTAPQSPFAHPARSTPAFYIPANSPPPPSAAVQNSAAAAASAARGTW